MRAATPDDMNLYYQDDRVTLWNGDARDLSHLPGACADMAFTCPPWWDSGDYGHPDQIGLGQSYPAYLSSLERMWAECFRCLKPGRAMIAWVSDLLWRDEPVPLVADAHHVLCKAGFVYDTTFYWYEPKAYDPPQPRPGMPLQIQPHVHAEVILTFRKPGTAEPPSGERLEASRIGSGEYQESRHAVWMPGGMLDHPYKRVIRLWSYSGDVILNPCAGQGTIPLLARHLNRKCIAIELNPDYCAHIAELLEAPELPHALR